jgi:hypothetical protein
MNQATKFYKNVVNFQKNFFKKNIHPYILNKYKNPYKNPVVDIEIPVFAKHIDREQTRFMPIDCDYYIVNDLYIYYKTSPPGVYSTMNVDLEKGYFYYYNLGENCKNVAEFMKKRQREQLEPCISPFVIYKHGEFLNTVYEKKYTSGILQTLALEGKQLDDILFITKVESRFSK